MSGKTMTVSDAVNEFTPCGGHRPAYRDFAKKLVGVTITPDPEPRPDFSEMRPWEVLEWVGRSKYTNQENHEEYVDLIGRVRALAHKFADAKGSGEVK